MLFPTRKWNVTLRKQRTVHTRGGQTCTAGAKLLRLFGGYAVGHNSCNRLAEQKAAKIAGRLCIENQDGQVVFLAQRNCGQIHHLQIAFEDLAIGEPVEASCVGDTFRIGVVDAINAGAFDDALCFDFDCA